MRLASLAELEAVDIVLTTYHTVSADWKGGAGNNDSVLFSNIWRRIVLDEGAFPKPVGFDATDLKVMFSAHFIRNEHSQMSRAVCELKATARWAVTGTPIQVRFAFDELSHQMRGEFSVIVANSATKTIRIGWMTFQAYSNLFEHTLTKIRKASRMMW